MMRFVPALSSLALLLACGEPSATETADPVEPSAGGETEGSVAVAEEHPMRTTTPVPVPQPAVPREELSEPLQATWTAIEEVVAIRPPGGPVVPTTEAIETWAAGPFSDWVQQRQGATEEVVELAATVPDEPIWEQALGAALFGYALEDFAAAIRSSEVPLLITEDEELLEVYMQALTEKLHPFAIEAVRNYAVCQQRLVTLGDESPWLPWRAYCVQRGREVIEVYELQPAELDLPEGVELVESPTPQAPDAS
jgi:hypothetical protein